MKKKSQEKSKKKCNFSVSALSCWCCTSDSELFCDDPFGHKISDLEKQWNYLKCDQPQIKGLRAVCKKSKVISKCFAVE